MVSPKCRGTHLCPRYAYNARVKTHLQKLGGQRCDFRNTSPPVGFRHNRSQFRGTLTLFSSLIAAAFCQLIATSRFWHSSWQGICLVSNTSFADISFNRGLGLISTVRCGRGLSSSGSCSFVRRKFILLLIRHNPLLLFKSGIILKTGNGSSSSKM